TAPYAGTAQPNCLLAFGGCPLRVMNDGPASGVWTLRIYDTNPGGGNTSALDSWRLAVRTGPRYEAPRGKSRLKRGAVLDVNRPVNAQIPDAPPSGQTWGRFTSTIQVGGKRFKGLRVRDVNLTLETTGQQADSAGDLLFTLTSPEGVTVWP